PDLPWVWNAVGPRGGLRRAADGALAFRGRLLGVRNADQLASSAMKHALRQDLGRIRGIDDRHQERQPDLPLIVDVAFADGFRVRCAPSCLLLGPRFAQADLRLAVP